MFDSLKIKNYQSHAETQLDFHEGLNVIVGSSDSGKSAVLRALRWLLYGYPRGDSFVRHGEKVTSVALRFKESTFSVMKKRKGSKTTVRAKGKIWENISAGLPEEVEERLGVSALNFEGQHDGFFLLQDSPGEVARRFNEISKLDIVDRMYSWFHSEALSVSRGLQEGEARVEELEGSIELIDRVLDESKPIVHSISVVTSDLNKVREVGGKVHQCLKTYQDIRVWVESEELIEGSLLLVTRVGAIKDQLGGIDTLYQKIDQFLSSRKSLKGVTGKLTTSEGLLEAYQQKAREVRDTQEQVDELVTYLDDWEHWDFQLEKQKKEIKRLLDEIPEVCPVCGGPLDETICTG